MVLTSAARLGCLQQKQTFCNSIKQVSLGSGWPQMICEKIQPVLHYVAFMIL
jgi:hypothetical protein